MFVSDYLKSSTNHSGALIVYVQYFDDSLFRSLFFSISHQLLS